MIQLNPQIPVYIPKRDMKGYAIGWIDYSQDHNLIWVVALQNTEIWLFENHEVRIDKNITIGRV